MNATLTHWPPSAAWDGIRRNANMCPSKLWRTSLVRYVEAGDHLDDIIALDTISATTISPLKLVSHCCVASINQARSPVHR